ncbi:hypothetical protein P2318_10990 [Myxococcaceae bacterium GXIMD 01537]
MPSPSRRASLLGVVLSSLLVGPLAAAEAPATAPAAPPPMPVQEARWCWEPLQGDLGPQDGSLLWVHPTLAARDAEPLWLAWEEGGLMRVRRWTAATGWVAVAGPVAEKTYEAHEPVLRVDASGAPVLLWLSRHGEQERGIHVARWDGTRWEPLGKTVAAPPESVNMALDARGRPIVVWFEKRARGGVALRAARWSGSAWEPLGRELASSPEKQDGQLAVAVDAQGAAWVAWAWGPDGRSFIRVARWNGKGWSDVGNTRGGVLRRKGSSRRPALALLPDGGAIVAWVDGVSRGSAPRELSRWTGKAWVPLASPMRPREEGRDAPDVTLTVPADGQPIVGWSEYDDATNFGHSYIQRLTPEGWQWLFQGFHLDGGQSSTQVLRFVATPDGGFHGLVDEPGAGRRRLRTFHARPCAQGEVPAPLPPIRAARSFWPTSVAQAVDILVADLDSASKDTVRQTPRDKLIRFHMGWGMGIRNSFGMWQGNTDLLLSCGEANGHPDSCSRVIIEATWERLQKDGPPAPAPDAGP